MNEHEVESLLRSHPNAQVLFNSQPFGIKPDGSMFTALVNVTNLNAISMLQGFMRDYPDSHYAVSVTKNDCGAVMRIIFGQPYVNVRIVY